MPPAGRMVGRRAPRRRRAGARRTAPLRAGAAAPRRPCWPRGGGRRGLSAGPSSPPRGSGRALRHAEHNQSCAPRRLAAACQRQRLACLAWPQCCGLRSKDGRGAVCRLERVMRGPRARESARAAGRGRLRARVRRRGLRASRGQAVAHGRGCHARAGAGVGAGSARRSGAGRMRASGGRPSGLLGRAACAAHRATSTCGRGAGRRRDRAARGPCAGPALRAAGQTADGGRQGGAGSFRVGCGARRADSCRVALELPVALSRRAVTQLAGPFRRTQVCSGRSERSACAAHCEL